VLTCVVLLALMLNNKQMRSVELHSLELEEVLLMAYCIVETIVMLKAYCIVGQTIVMLMAYCIVETIVLLKAYCIVVDLENSRG